MATRHYSACLTPDRKHCKSTQTLTPSLTNPHPYSHQQTPERKNSLYSKPFTPPFVSVYGQKTRLEQVMRLKTRPVTANKGTVEALLALQEKSQIELHPQPSRLQKIMALKVPKPTVVSTLANYQPRVVTRQVKEKENNPPDERLWECQQACKREEEAQQRLERQWRLEEREREQELQRQRKQAQRQAASQRRKQAQFQALVEKQVRKIQRERELSQRKNGGFAIYIYPEC